MVKCKLKKRNINLTFQFSLYILLKQFNIFKFCRRSLKNGYASFLLGKGGLYLYYYDDDRGMSGRHSYRRRDSMGRYADGGNMSYRRMYDAGMSGHDMREQLERMMEEADSDRERQALRAAMSKL